MNPIDAKTRIMNTAAKLFAEKGFDGARVDDIARKAKVNKALIYYYFKNKEEIRQALFDDFINDVMDLVDESLDDFMDLQSMEKFRKVFDEYLNFFEERKHTIRIMAMESLKKSSKVSPLFHFMDLMMKNEMGKVLKVLEKKGLQIEVDRMQVIVTDFFTGLMPIVNYVLYKEDWMAHYRIDEQEMRERFFKAYDATHLEYHRGGMKLLEKMIAKKT